MTTTVKPKSISDHIPPEAVEAAARAFYDLRIGGDPSIGWKDAAPGVQNMCRNKARACLSAGLAAWPDKALYDWCGVDSLILPLNTENENAKG